VALGRIHRQDVAGEEVKVLGPAHRPEHDVMLGVGGLGEGQAALVSFTSASSPIFFHCCLIISATWVYGMNCPPTVINSMRSRPFPSVRRR